MRRELDAAAMTIQRQDERAVFWRLYNRFTGITVGYRIPFPKA